MNRATLMGALCLAFSLTAKPVRGADTVEVFDVGASDVEFYLGLDGMGLRAADREAAGELMVGYGLLPNLSAYMGAALAGNGYLTNGTVALYVGVFGTPLDTDHVDLDLVLDVCAEGDGLSEFGLSPGIELNFDLDPDMNGWGAYVRASANISGRTNGASGSDELTVGTGLVFGTYYRFFETHEVLLEYDMEIDHTPDKGDPTVGIGGLALGYNVILTDSIELISHVGLDVPQDGEELAGAVVVGFIATLPAAD